MKNSLRLCLALLVLTGCTGDPAIQEQMLDGGTIFDPSLYEPEKYLVSKAYPNPTPEEALKPVIIVSHGYTATTFEWDEFRTYAQNREDVLISQVLLDGHGRSYENFKNTGWKDWQQAIIKEYDLLTNAGYQNIHLLGSSTSGALFIDLLAGDFFKNKPAPRQILLVDPIVIPSNKTLSLIHIFGPMLGYLESDQSIEEDKVYYRYRPEETLRELQNLLNKVRKDLENGIVLPAGSELKIYKSRKDATADPVSAVLIYKGMKTSTGAHVEVEMVDSQLHVYTRLDLRPHIPADTQNQTDTFNDILSRVRGN